MTTALDPYMTISYGIEGNEHEGLWRAAENAVANQAGQAGATVSPAGSGV